MTTGTSVHCPHCERPTEHSHVHDAAHGIAGTHMAGTERYICNTCGHAIFATEGERMGLPFPLDGRDAA